MRNKLCKIFGLLRMSSASFWAFLALQKPGRRKRMVMLPLVLFGLVAAVCCASVPSSVSAQGGSFPDAPFGSYHLNPSASFILYSDNSKTTCKYSAYPGLTDCDISVNKRGQILHVYFSENINANTYLNFTITYHGTSNVGAFGGVSVPGSAKYSITDVDYAFNTYQGIGIVNVTLFTGDFGSRNNFELVINSTCKSTDNGCWLTISRFSGSGQMDTTWFTNQIGALVGNTAKIQQTNDILNSIKNNGIKATVDNSGVINSINNSANQAHKDSQAQLDALEEQNRLQAEQNKQEQDRYDQDKQEEADREHQGNEDANKLGSLFSFNILNPFIGIFDMFIADDGCASIPVLASWVHSETSTVCPWFNQNVRNVLTPVFSLASSMLLFGFIVRWLDGGNFAGGIEV